MEVLFLHSDILKFIDRLDDATYAEAFRLIDMLSVKEHYIGMPHSKKIKKDIYELRVLSQQHVRIFYTFHAGRAVLLHVISKKSQKLPVRDIETAQKRLATLQ